MLKKIILFFNNVLTIVLNSYYFFLLGKFGISWPLFLKWWKWMSCQATKWQNNHKSSPQIVYYIPSQIVTEFHFWANYSFKALFTLHTNLICFSNPVFRTGCPKSYFARNEIGIHLFRQYSQCLVQLHWLWQSWRRCHHDAKRILQLKLASWMSIMASHHGAKLIRFTVFNCMNASILKYEWI